LPTPDTAIGALLDQSAFTDALDRGAGDRPTGERAVERLELSAAERGDAVSLDCGAVEPANDVGSRLRRLIHFSPNAASRR
jgi:hypothetical protein